MKNENLKCLNCEESHDNHFKFCPHCGQKSNEHLTLGVLFYNTISDYFSFDARFFRSFFPLLFRPGYIAKEFIKGKRLRYLHPSQMYLFIAVIFFFIFSFYARDGREALDKEMEKQLSKRNEKIDNSEQNTFQDSIAINSVLQPIKDNSELIGLDDGQVKVLDSLSEIKVPKKDVDFGNKKLDSLIAINAPNEQIYKAMGMPENPGFFTKRFYTQGLKFYKTLGAGQVFQTFIDSIPIAMFFLLPIFALILKLFYFRKGRYSHHLVFSFYYFSFLFTVFSIIFGINLFGDFIPDALGWLIALSTFFYLYFAIMKFYETGWFFSFIKTSIISFVFLLIVTPVSFLILTGIAFYFY